VATLRDGTYLQILCLPEKLAMATHSRLLYGSVSDEEKSLKTLTPGGGADPVQNRFY